MDLCCFGVSKQSRRKNFNSKGQDEEINTNVRLFSYNMLRSATRNFHPSNKLGGGGFGTVYKGLLRDDTHVAVKSLSSESEQGTREFLTEIDMISNVRHPNLVQLIGCCIEGSNRMLVYEYLENNSLAIALFGSREKQFVLDLIMRPSRCATSAEVFCCMWVAVIKEALLVNSDITNPVNLSWFSPKDKRISMDWPTRASICIGIAKGLVFLHEEMEPHIVHRDIKASNILLDKQLNPKIGDFGLAKLFPDNVTHVSTRVAGTMGYLAPEYALLGQLTKKADIYSFGILILEMISARSSSKSAWGEDMMLLVDWTWKLREENRLLDLVDPELVEFPAAEVELFVKVAIFCTQAAANQRPSMKQVVKMLTKGKLTFKQQELTQPGVYKSNNTITTTPHSGSGSGSSHEKISQLQLQKGKQLINPYLSSTQVNTPPVSMIQMQPR